MCVGCCRALLCKVGEGGVLRVTSLSVCVGCCRALLCKVGEGGVLRVTQLSVDHDLNNQTELQRLLQLGLDVEKIRQVKCFPYVLIVQISSPITFHS